MSRFDFFPPREGIELVGGIKILPAEAAKQNRRQNGFIDRPLPMGMMNFSVIIKRDGFMADVIKTFDLYRLNRIRQLQSITYLGIGRNSSRLPDGDHVFPHTRLLPHSILCGALRALIATYIQKADPTETRVAILEDLIHDAATCAGGDAWRNIDLPRAERLLLRRTLFNEDAHIREIFERHRRKWRALREKYGLPKDTPERAKLAIDQEIGIDGALHTFTDTLSYLACDIGALLSLYGQAGLRLPKRLKLIRELATPEIFNLWQNLAISGQKVVVKAPQTLHRFLKLRLAMCTGIYNHPGHKIIELLTASVIYPKLWENLVKRPNILLEIHDGKLESMIKTAMQMKNISRRLDAFGKAPHRIVTSCRDKALALEEWYANRGYLTLFMDCTRFVENKTKSSKYFVEGPDGQPLTFAMAFPKAADELSCNANALPDNKRYHLVIFERAKFSATFEKAWREARRNWRLPV